MPDPHDKHPLRTKQDEDRKQREKSHIQNQQQQHGIHASKMDTPYTNPGYRGGAEYSKLGTQTYTQHEEKLKGTQKRGRGS